MENTSENKTKNHPASPKRICLGILAHVDAGKTTLSEAMLYGTGAIRKMGRVDDGSAFLDTYRLERDRGITIFSKQAMFTLGDTRITLLDTPGHVDFSAEMERTLQVLDYAVLVISGADGVQGHTETLWRLLERYRIPTFLFVNKMDQPGTDREALLAELRSRLSSRMADFGRLETPEDWEELACCDEELMERYLEQEVLPGEELARAIGERRLFPCYFGSALRLSGVEEFLRGLDAYTRSPAYPEKFGARVFKIARDDQGKRLTYLKLTGGRLRVKDVLTGRCAGPEGEETWEEKADQIRLYSGARYEAVPEAEAGEVCAVVGLSHTYPGEGLGVEPDARQPMLEPVLTYQLQFPEDCDVHQMLPKLRQLEEEEPELHLVWDPEAEEIRVQLMGEVQTEILQSLIQERFGVPVTFGAGSIVYKETIRSRVEGVGHFEPLRHYAEVHLILEPGEPGSGLVFTSVCSEDQLDRNWQRLVLTHLAEREHPGVLTGSAITDMKITLAAGRAHTKHTEGGDFRQATYRAVRQGLMKADCVLLEPYYAFRLEIPAELVGRALTDIQRMNGTFGDPQTEGERTVIEGSAPVATMQDYPREVISYTRGRGRLFCRFQGYQPCHNQEEVVAAMGYDPDRDLENPTGSVFCSHGAGYLVTWDQVEEHMHLESVLRPERQEESRQAAPAASAPADFGADEKELQEIFARTYRNSGGGKGRNIWRRQSAETSYRPGAKAKETEPLQEYLLVDGYNIIFAWEELRQLAEASIDGARTRLMDILCNYQGFRRCTVILVFDAYKVQNHACEILPYHNIHVVYTQEAETADQYIEKVAHELSRKYRVTVATSDRLEQIIIMGQGAARLSARDLEEEIRRTEAEIRETYEKLRPGERSYLLDQLVGELAVQLKALPDGEEEPARKK